MLKSFRTLVPRRARSERQPIQCSISSGSSLKSTPTSNFAGTGALDRGETDPSRDGGPKAPTRLPRDRNLDEHDNDLGASSKDAARSTSWIRPRNLQWQSSTTTPALLKRRSRTENPPSLPTGRPQSSRGSSQPGTRSPIHKTGIHARSSSNVPAHPGFDSVEALRDILEAYRRDEDSTSAVSAIRWNPQLAHYFSTPAFSELRILRKFAESRHYQYSIELVRVAEAMDLELEDAFLQICDGLWSRKAWSLLREVAEEALSKCKPNPRWLEWSALASIKLGNSQLQEAILSDFASLGCTPPPSVYRGLFVAALESGDVPQAEHILELVCDSGHPSSPLVDELDKAPRSHLPRIESKILAMLPSVEKAEFQVGVLNAMIRRHLTGTWERIEDVFHLLSFFIPETLVLFKAALDLGERSTAIFAQPNSTPAPLSFLPELLIPTEATFNIFARYCATKQNIDGTVFLLHSMAFLEHSPATLVLALIVSACCEAHRPGLAIELVAGICDPAVTPLGMFKELHPHAFSDPASVLHRIHLRNSKEVTVFNALIRSLRTHQGRDVGDQVLRIMELNGVSPDRETMQLFKGKPKFWRDNR
ncbi:hypothetical protein DFP72DRAFT_407050 [Ephemerocybe angulata]|uniref:Uncharacterized protein n=1 Tax=Ephemerocybe angulata TaxID=980116 RepID=A0A8H6HW56_9AGAR|nr:hypothetical protein DFP72DRAFT_407050 [Tulosesus angulatus]